jgi:hypothetical protein
VEPCSQPRAVEAFDLDAFRSRADRFLFALDADERLVYLRQGQAAQMRIQARERLRCPEPDCSSPEITTVSRSPGGRRDGFRHLVRPDVAHAPESALHRQGKALVARWAAAHPEVAEVQLEARIGDGERVADVMLTSRKGNRLAVEVQYAGVSLAAWRDRSASYARLGIEVVWLWGHIGAHSPLAGRWRDIALDLVRAGRPVLWINPSEECIAWAWDVEGFLEPPSEPARPTITFGTLDGLEVRQSGLYPPGFLWAKEAAREAAQAERDRLAEEAVRQRERSARIERQRVSARRRAAMRAEQIALLRATPPMPPGGPWTHCLVCGLPLDPILQNVGVHFGESVPQ